MSSSERSMSVLMTLKMRVACGVKRLMRMPLSMKIVATSEATMKFCRSSLTLPVSSTLVLSSKLTVMSSSFIDCSSSLLVSSSSVAERNSSLMACSSSFEARRSSVDRSAWSMVLRRWSRSCATSFSR
jgi:hypothetical protein